MNMAAFQEVFHGAITLELESNLIITIPSIAGLTILKLFAWINRRNERDMLDIRRLLETYAVSSNLDRIYEEELPVLGRLHYDTTRAGVHLLGKDPQQVVDQSVRDKLSAALSEDLIERLVTGIAGSFSRIEDRTDLAAPLLKELFNGLGIETLL
jgi:predicted nucleotidyltransferase